MLAGGVAFQEKAGWHVEVSSGAGWSRRHRGACLAVDGVAFQEKAGYVEDELLPVRGGAECTERVLALHAELYEKGEVTSLGKGVTSNASLR